MTGMISLKRPASLLEAVGFEALDRYRTPQAAVECLVSEIKDSGGMAIDLFDNEAVASAALALLEKLAKGRAER
jgi:hypothetical protein